ncbi:MAG: Fe-S cluster assembly protein SufD [Flavobacteriales bacterium]|jgi:Fe-S cluster assembly protein SufD|nr:Fe-S cluster assembly protein SufD [Flavobacteriales bacterium]
MGLLEKIEQYTNGGSDKVSNKTAYSKFIELGFPSVKNEEWKYTSLKKIIAKSFEIENQGEQITDQEIKNNSLQLDNKVVFLNGELYQKPTISGVKIEKNIDHSPIYNDAITALNAALAKNGYSITVNENTIVDQPIEILFLTKNKSENLSQYRNEIIVKKNSNIKIIEQVKNLSNNLCFSNMFTNINLEEKAIIELNKLQNNNESQIIVDNTNVNQETGSNSTLNTLLFGGSFTRNNLSFSQNGERCESNMNGVVILDNVEFADNHTYMDHLKANCESNELYKGIYLGKSKGVFNGKIMVRPDAQKINAFQANNNLLLSDDSSINSKPQLEIYADDVKCSHGCTIGQLDEDAIFYMNTRGISKEDAKAILTYAFASDALNKISIPHLYNVAKDLISKKLNVDLSF